MRNTILLGFRKKKLFLSITVLIALQTACLPFVKINKNSFANSSPLSPNQSPKKVLAEEFNLKSASDAAKKETYELLLAKDFAAIERVADETRKKKERLPGGYWKLDSVYEGLSNIYAEYPGQEVTEEMWKNRIELLKQWKENSPESITARIALAKSYMGYGWFARGRGYINTVSKENYELLHERLNSAQRELLEAEKLSAKCPRWYREMLFLGMAKGWSLDEFDEIYEEAIKNEPAYLQYYLIKSENLTPKWNGERGDWQKFVDSLPSKLATLKTDEADIIYFVVVVNKLNDSSLGINWTMVSKDRIEKGFSDINKKYGADNLRLNQYAFVSCLTMNFPAANEAFNRIGNDWNKEVWSVQLFNQMKQFAAQGGTVARR